MIKVKEISASQTYPLRIEILRNGIAENYNFDDDKEINTFHLGAFKDDELIGIATFIQKKHLNISDKLSYQLRGMAVNKKLQSQGIGKHLVEKSYKLLEQKNCTILWCNAREIAVEFYKRLGFTIKGNTFEISKIGKHYTMFKYLYS